MQQLATVPFGRSHRVEKSIVSRMFPAKEPAHPARERCPSFALKHLPQSFHPRVHFARIFLAVLVCLIPSTSFGQQKDKSEAEKLALIYNGAMQAFQQGRWGEAANGLEQLIKLVPNEGQSQIQPAYFTLGAAYFNIPDYPRAIEVFKGFVAKFPNADRILDARLALAQSYLAAKDFAEAIKLYSALEAVPAAREMALAAQAQAYKIQNKPDDAIRVLEKLVGADIRTNTQANGAVTLIELYAGKSQIEKAAALLERLQARLAVIDNLVGLNGVAIKLADSFADKKMYPEAISCYRLVRPREEVIKFQTDRIAAIENRIAYNARVGPGNPELYVKANQENNKLKSLQAESKTLLDEFMKLPDYAAPILFRMARCWYEWDKKWEALVVYRRLLQRFPDSPEREPAMFDIVVTFADLERIKSTQEACDRYLKEFPAGENASTVGYMSGAVALQAGDYAGAEASFASMLEKQPNSTYREQMRFLLGNAKFAQGRYDEANKDYTAYLEAYPKGESIEEVTYRLAVSHVFSGAYEKALTMLTAYIQQYPQGNYLPDAKYRVAVCKYAASEFEMVIRDCEAWAGQFPDDPMAGEVLALLGDAYAATREPEKAASAYVSSFKKATTDEVLNYSLFEASKQLQKLGKWDEVATLFTDFVTEKPDHPSVVAAMFWIGKARARQGQVEEAKQLMVDNLRKYIAEPKREAVEQLLTQLAQLCSKRPRSIALEEQGPPSAGSPTAYDPFAELERLLKPLEEGAGPTTKARLLYARAELAAMKKQEDLREQILREMSGRFRPEELSPVLLAVVGDFLLAHGDAERATVLFQQLRENYPKSDHLDVAYVGLGEIAFANKDYAKALGLFSDALDKVAASMKMKEATIGKARTLLEMGNYEESRKLFEQVAGIREWRGDATAMAIYSLGQIAARQSQYPEAIAYYRRVFVAYQKYLPWVAKSYLQAAESFTKMGKNQDAIDNLRDMLRNEKLQKLPEYEVAKRRLVELGGEA